MRFVRRGLLLPVLGLLLAGCGIRPTEVPTDFGAAPSRVRCSLSDADSGTAQSAGGVPMRVFLLCGSSLVAVDRTVPVPDGATGAKRRVLVAQGLLDQLARTPTAPEKEAGYTTDVHTGTTVLPSRLADDPDDALRLNAAPDSLSAYALAQIVCTLSDSAATEGNGSTVLGGPGTGDLRRYECTDEVRSRPGGEVPPSAAVTGG